MIERKSDYRLLIETLRDVLVLAHTHDGFLYSDAENDPSTLINRIEKSQAFQGFVDAGVDHASLVKFLCDAFFIWQKLPIIEKQAPVKQCEYCGKLFRPKRHYFMYCGYVCANKAKEENG